MSAPVTATAASFDKEIASGLVLVDFWAAWCGPCRMVAPVLEELAASLPALRVVKVNVDEEDAVAMRYGIRSIPTLVLLRDGHEADRVIGYLPKERLAARIAPHLA